MRVVACGGPEERKPNIGCGRKNIWPRITIRKPESALKNVLKIDPKDAQAFYLLGSVEEKEQNWRNAFGHYLRVVELDPQHREALIKIGKIYLQGRVFDKTLETADILLSFYPEDPLAHTLTAAVIAQRGNIPDAFLS